MTKINDNLIEKDFEKKSGDKIFYIFFSFVIVVLMVFLYLNNSVYKGIVVSGSSMEPTFYSNDILSMNVKKDFKRGDIVIIDKGDNYWIIKRIIAVGGDEVRIGNGVVELKKSGESDFTKLEEEYLPKGTVTDIKTETADHSLEDKVYLIDEGTVFYLGDNREVSRDSRIDGAISEEHVLGVVAGWSIKIKGFSTGVNNFVQGIGKAFKKK